MANTEQPVQQPQVQPQLQKREDPDPEVVDEEAADEAELNEGVAVNLEARSVAHNILAATELMKEPWELREEAEAKRLQENVSRFPRFLSLLAC